MQEAVAIKQEFYQDYVSPDGLALLGKGHSNNSNGILFLAFFLMLLKKGDYLTSKDLVHAFNTTKSLEVQPGLFSRLPHNSGALEAQDNFVGIATISVLFDFVFAREIVEFGTAHGFAYDNHFPESPRKESIRQGGDVAFYKICAGFLPTIWELAWLCIGIISGGVKGSPSTVNLTWLRIQTLALALDKKQSINLFSGAGLSLYLSSLIFNLAINKRFGGIQGSFARYYSEDHPIRRLAKELSI